MAHPRWQTWLAALGSLLLAGCQSAFFTALKAPNAGQDVERERIEFSAAPKLALDVYRPPGLRGTAPTVLFLYGGSWQNGKRGWYQFVGKALAARGLVVAIPDYRKSPQVSFPTFVEDAATALAFVHTHLQRFGGDPARLYLVGHSAGAHIAGLLATDARYLAAHGLSPRQLRGVALLSGPLDFLPMTSPAIIRVFNGDARNARSQPINFVDGDEPPTLLLHGGDDGLVYTHNSENLHRALGQHGVPSTLKIYPEVGHMGVVLAFSKGLRGIAPVLEDVLAWINHTPAPSSPPSG